MPKKAGIGFALATILLDAIGIGLIFPIMPDLLLDLGIETISDATLYGGALFTVYAVMQFIFSPIIGNLSDHFGRRPVLLIAIAAMFVDYIIMGFATVFIVLFIGRVLAGIAGATVATAAAYIADVSTLEDKARNFGLIGAAFGIGFVLGPALGGILGDYSLRLPFFAAAGLSLINLIFGLMFIPESLDKSKRRAFTVDQANPFNSLKRAFSHTNLRPLLWATFLLMLAASVYPVVWSYYGKIKFGWDLRVIGYSLAGYAIFMIIVQGVLVGPIVKRMGEAKTIYLGTYFIVIGLVALALTTETWLAFALLPIVAFGEIAGPAISGYASNLMDETEQGELQGILASVRAMSAVVAPLVMSGLFYLFTSVDFLPYFPGAPFVMAAVFVCGAIVILKRSLSSK